jgi:leader peptidase (prepilin peptidase)/N-methyltransferase
VFDNVLAAVIGAVTAIVLSPALHLAMQRSPMRQRYGASVWHCANCGDRLLSVQRFPLVAKMRGMHHCGTCGATVAKDSPWFELVLLVALAAVGGILGLTLALPAYLVFVAALLAISVVDFRLYLIPSRMLYPALFACLVLMIIPAVQQPERYGIALLTMFGSWLFFFIVYMVHPRGLGFGDVRLALLNGFMTGWVAPANAYLGVLLGLLAGALVGSLLMVLRKKSRKDHFPFGPWLALGAVLAVFGPIALG